MTIYKNIASKLRRLRNEDDGQVVVFGLLLAAMTVGFGGFAVDLMRVEARRATIQGALDNALLAAADVDQKAEPVGVVIDYMTKAGFAAALDGRPVLDTTNGRTIRASIKDTTNPIFQMFTRPLTIASTSSATNSAPRLEISVVLDISGSMSGTVATSYDYWGYPISSTTRIDEMRKGAKRFINTLLGDGTKSNVSISIIPFSEQVGIGPKLFDQLGLPRLHSYSNCIDFPDSEFTKTNKWSTNGPRQEQHFQWYANSYYIGQDTICPYQSYEQVSLHSRNPTELGKQIDQLKPRTGTAIYYGVKWGAMLLDPSLRSAIQGTGQVDTVFSNRPYDYQAAGVHKIIVVMSDGENSSSVRIADSKYDTAKERKKWSEQNFGYWYNYLADYYQASGSVNQRYDYYKGNTLLSDACNAAKARGIEIYSIGVHMTQRGAAPLRACASSQAHYYDVKATEIDEAFTSIAMHSVNLRLTR